MNEHRCAPPGLTPAAARLHMHNPAAGWVLRPEHAKAAMSAAVTGMCRRAAVPGVGPHLAGALPADGPGGALEHARRGAGRAAVHVLPIRGAPPAAGAQLCP